MSIAVLLRCKSRLQTQAFYRDQLGFRVSTGDEESLFAELEGNRLIFTVRDLWRADVGFSGTIYCTIGDTGAYYAQVRQRIVPAWPLQDMPYGRREFGLVDCNGYYLAFAQIDTQN